MIETERLLLREFTTDDAPFVLELVNDSDWIKFIGDRGVRTLKDAKTYIIERLQKSYREFGFGMWLVQRTADGESIGMCGLLKREYLDDLDIGFGFLPAFRGHGYAFESASAVIEYGRKEFGLKRLVGFVLVGNQKSVALLNKLGMRYEHNFKIPNDAADLELYNMEF
jgi:ribosomal-protein-alanine N-acetyltransferase